MADATSKKIRNVYIGIFVISTLYLIMMFVVEVFNTNLDEKTLRIESIMLALVYSIDSVGLLGATFILIKTLNDDFSGTTF